MEILFIPTRYKVQHSDANGHLNQARNYTASLRSKTIKKARKFKILKRGELYRK